MSAKKIEVAHRWVDFIQVYWNLLDKETRDSYLMDMIECKEPPSITLEDMTEIEKTAMRQHQGNVVRKYRTKNNLNLEQLAELIGKKFAYVSLIESGLRVLKVDDMYRIMESLDIPATEMFEFEIPKPKEQ